MGEYLSGLKLRCRIAKQGSFVDWMRQPRYLARLSKRKKRRGERGEIIVYSEPT